MKGDARKGLFFVRKTLENNWGRGVLMNFLTTDLYERQGAALTNFSMTMPTPESDLAQEYFKDPYRFEFVQLNEECTEKELIPLHRYCVIEVKTTEFDFPDLGQLAGYTAMVDDLMNTPVENAAIGLLICKEKNTVLARYALSRINTPIGISEYEVAKRQLPKELQDQLPTEEEIEQGLNKSSELDS